MSVQGLRRVAVVLEQVVTDFGRRLIEDPARLRGLLTDTLGAEASQLHEAIEAVVLAAELGIAQAALDEVDRHSLIAQLGDGFEDPDLASAVVDAWISALGIQDRTPTDGPTVAPPPLGPGSGMPSSPATATPTELPPPADDKKKTVPVVSSSTADAPPVTMRDRLTSAVSERKVAVLSVAAFFVIALAGVGAASFWGGSPSTTTTTEVHDTTTTVDDTTTTTLAPLTALAHDEQITSWGATINRTWEIVDDQLVMRVSASSADEAISGTVWEVFPDSLGVDASTLGFSESAVVSAVYANDSVVRLVLDLGVNTDWELEYSIPLPESAEEDPTFLESLHEEWKVSMEEFLATPRPSLELTSTAPVGNKVTINGKATPGAEVQINGAIVEASDDGTFEYTLTLQQGTNTALVRAIDWVRGQSTEEELSWEYTTTTTSSTTTTTKAPPPPSNKAPIAVNDSYEADDDGSGNGWDIGPLCNDSDPDGDPFFITSVTTSVGTAYVQTLDNHCKGNGADSNAIRWEGGGYLGTVTFTYVISDGEASASATITFCVESPINPVYCP